ncbi:MAG: ammonia-forming cytochrome c nitrite reductase subunit c552 [Sedimentisphaerales bacterium]|nr:ammonia-forming cytochrome c nitrite reductase subunit c552 [Sedimentisphaerales bacterium]
MTSENHSNRENKSAYPNPQAESRPSLPSWAGMAIVFLTAAVIVLLGLLATSIMERRWESQRPALVLKPIDQWESDNAKWGENYPREYESYLKGEITDTETKFGGAYPRDYLDADPYQVILFAGYGFGKDYLQGRSHFYAVEDINKTKRIKPDFYAATCWTCKSPDVPRLMNTMGVKEFYASNWHDLKNEITHPIGCQDCHEPQTMNLRISRPALKEAFAAMGKDIEKATHQEMRSLVCAQCHVEYYFETNEKTSLKNYLTFPWGKGTTVEQMIEYYDETNFSDFLHPISKTPIVKAQHPDYEMFMTGVHAYRDVSCSDCHMPYKTEGGLKFTDHHVQSPLLNISNSCAICHRWSEEEVRSRVETIQTKNFEAKMKVEKALVEAHFDVAAAAEAGATDAELAEPRKLLRHAQFRWDYVSANNGMGFHSPQESMRVLADSVNQAQQARLMIARLLATRSVKALPQYPDVSTREKAWNVAKGYVDGNGVKILK